MAKKYFEQVDGPLCYPLETIKNRMKVDDVKERKVYTAHPDYGSGFFWCKEYGESGESGYSDCGKLCPSYKPRNGKNGRCAHSTHCYVPGEEIIIKL